MCGNAHHSTVVIRYMLTSVQDRVVAPFEKRRKKVKKWLTKGTDLDTTTHNIHVRFLIPHRWTHPPLGMQRHKIRLSFQLEYSHRYSKFCWISNHCRYIKVSRRKWAQSDDVEIIVIKENWRITSPISPQATLRSIHTLHNDRRGKGTIREYVKTVGASTCLIIIPTAWHEAVSQRNGLTGYLYRWITVWLERNIFRRWLFETRA